MKIMLIFTVTLLFVFICSTQTQNSTTVLMARQEYKKSSSNIGLNSIMVPLPSMSPTTIPTVCFTSVPTVFCNSKDPKSKCETKINPKCDPKTEPKINPKCDPKTDPKCNEPKDSKNLLKEVQKSIKQDKNAFNLIQNVVRTVRIAK
jgi:hypothetical protein